MIDNKIVTDLADAVNQTAGTSAYDTTAEVIRIEDGTAWVHIPGGIDETPVTMSVNAQEGDTVRVRVAGGQAWIVGNDTAPPTDDTEAENAKEKAVQAQKTADVAVQDAERAKKAADAAQESADQAAIAAASAQSSADEAQTAADEAKTQAVTATNYANNALTQLSVVEDVVNVLNWISEHGTYTLTEDTEVIADKYYFTREGEGTELSPYVYAVVTNPESDPSEAGYYELSDVDESIANYISMHLALTDEGLFLALDGNGYKLKVTNTGMYVVDPEGTVVASYSTTTVIGSQTGAHLEATSDRLSFKDANGTEVAYIAVDPDTNESVFYMTKAIVVQDLFFGDWRWNSRANGNLALKWVGSEE